MSEFRNRICVAVSGSGRTLENFLRRKNEFTYEIVAVIASREDCRGVEVARGANLPVFIDSFANEAEVTPKLYEWLQQQRVGMVALGGFLKKFPVKDGWEDRIVNIHPSLLPKFGGKGMYGSKVHRAVIEAGECESGATVHFVNDRYDEGRVIQQFTVKVEANDTPELLAARVFQAECEMYPKILDELVGGRIQ